MRRTTYIHQRPDWPAFRWDGASISAQLAAVRFRQGRLLGRLAELGPLVRADTTLSVLTEDALKTSEIEGETLDADQVRSSLARRLGLEASGGEAFDRRADAIAAVVLDATRNYADPLTAERLFQWHRWLFAGHAGGRFPLTVGAWRTDEFGAMIVQSGPDGRGRVHFEAPAAVRVAGEMDGFLTWFEDGSDPTDPVLRAAIAHLWFVTIHPFDDGNGRIGRAIADMALARSEGTGQRFYSLSTILRRERPAYYATLEAMQRGDLDITPRLAWFLGVLDGALAETEGKLAQTLRAGALRQVMAGHDLNVRQRGMLDRLLDGFEGKLTTAKWAQIAKCSQDTALRDIAGLIGLGLLVQEAAGGRSTSYRLAGEG